LIEPATDLEDTTLAIATASPLNKVHAIQSHLKKFGMPSSKWQELALTGMVADSQSCGPNAARTQFQRMLRANAEQSYWDIAPEEVKVNPKDMAGVSAPLGFWDPLGLSTTFKFGSEALLFFREAEIKHGRVCMLATLGIFAGEKYHPFLGGNIDLPAAKVRSMLLETDFQDFWLLALIAIAGAEVASVQTQYDAPFWEFNDKEGYGDNGGWGFSTKKKQRLPGEFGFDPLGLKPTDPAELKEIQTKEINNGRLAMIAAAGMLAQEMVNGKEIF